MKEFAQAILANADDNLTCAECDALLPEYVFAELAPAEADKEDAGLVQQFAEVQRHLSACPRCSEEYTQLKAMLEASYLGSPAAAAQHLTAASRSEHLAAPYDALADKGGRAVRALAASRLEHLKEFWRYGIPRPLAWAVAFTSVAALFVVSQIFMKGAVGGLAIESDLWVAPLVDLTSRESGTFASATAAPTLEGAPLGGETVTLRSLALPTLMPASTEPATAVVAAAPGLPSVALSEPMMTPIRAISTPDWWVGTFEYTVQTGESLPTIAEKFDVEMQTLRELNFLLDDTIFAGQVLTVPYLGGVAAGGAPRPRPTLTPFRYIVQPGDSFASIALQFGVRSYDLIASNSIVDSLQLTVGMPLLIRADGSAGLHLVPITVTHVVQAGENLGSIANDYGVSIETIMAANGLNDPDVIAAGEELRIPLAEEQPVAP